MTATTTPTPSAWLSAADIARETRLSRSESYRLLRDGTLPSFTVGLRSLRVRREDFEAWRLRVEGADIRHYNSTTARRRRTA